MKAGSGAILAQDALVPPGVRAHSGRGYRRLSRCWLAPRDIDSRPDLALTAERALQAPAGSREGPSPLST